MTLEQLANPFATAICEHLVKADRQGQFTTSQFLHACRRFNKDEITRAQLLETTARLGFVNVIDAFHIVNQGRYQCSSSLTSGRPRGYPPHG